MDVGYYRPIYYDKILNVLKNLRMIATLATASLLIPVQSAANEFSFMDDHAKLKNHVIAAADDVEKLEVRTNQFTTEERLKMGNLCFRPKGFVGYWGFGKKAGLLLVDKNQQISIATLEDKISSIEVKIFPVDQAGC